MLFGYPIAATQNNWLHDCICQAIRNIHDAISNNGSYPGWPAVLPLEYRESLESRSGLRERLQAYDAVVRGLEEVERNLLIDALEGSNRVSELLAGACDCVTLDALPELAHKPVVELFEFAFLLLTKLGIRDLHYKHIYEVVGERLCPFCGTEHFDAPGAPREAMDHYLARSKYPFAAANLRNLIPMGHKCNSSYKSANDLLRRADGSRRVVFDPYGHGSLQLTLNDSCPFDGINSNTPRWIIRFEPDTPAVSTWDEVFSIRLRYQRDHLDPSFSGWLRLFAGAAKRRRVRIDSDEALIAELKRIEEDFEDAGFQDRAFLKAAVFRMLRFHCEAGDQRLLNQLRDLVALRF